MTAPKILKILPTPEPQRTFLLRRQNVISNGTRRQSAHVAQRVLAATGTRWNSVVGKISCKIRLRGSGVSRSLIFHRPLNFRFSQLPQLRNASRCRCRLRLLLRLRDRLCLSLLDLGLRLLHLSLGLPRLRLRGLRLLRELRFFRRQLPHLIAQSQQFFLTGFKARQFFGRDLILFQLLNLRRERLQLAHLGAKLFQFGRFGAISVVKEAGSDRRRQKQKPG